MRDYLNPIKTGGGGGGRGRVFHHARGFLPITLEVIKVHSRNLVTFPKLIPNKVKVTNFKISTRSHVI